MNFRNTVLLYGSFLLVFLAPLVFWNHGLFPHISSKTFFIFGVVEMLFFVWLYTILVDHSYRLSRKVLWYFAPLVLFTAWMTLSGILSPNTGLSFWSSLGRGTGLLTLYHCLAFSFITASLVQKYGMSYIRRFFGWFIAGAGILALSVWGGTDGFRLTSRALLTDHGGGLAGNSTLTAGYFLFALMMAVFLLIDKAVRTRTKVLIGGVVFVILFSPVFLSLYRLATEGIVFGTARGTLIALMAGIVTTGVAHLFTSGKKILRAVSIGMVALGLIVSSAVWVKLVTPGTTIHELFAQEARGSRFIFWDTAQKAMNERPVFGYGPENYFLAFQEHFNPQILIDENSFEGWSDRAHNIYYDLGVTGGYPAFILYVVFLLGMFYVVYRAHKRGRLSRMQASLFAGLLVAYGINLLLTFESNLSMMALFALAGMLYVLVDEEEGIRKIKAGYVGEGVRGAIALVLGALFIASITFLVFRPAGKSKAYAEVFSANIAVRPTLYQTLLGGSSVGEQWDVSGLAFDTYKKYAENPAQVKRDAQNEPSLISNVEALLVYLYGIEERNTENYRYYITVVFLENTLTYLTEKSFNEASADRVWRMLERARELSPTNPNVYWSIAQLEAWEGNIDGVEQAYRDAIVLDPYLPSSHKLLLNFARAIGRPLVYEEALKQAESFIPDFREKYLTP